MVETINSKMKDIDKNYVSVKEGSLEAAAGFGSGDARWKQDSQRLILQKKNLKNQNRI